MRPVRMIGEEVKDEDLKEEMHYLLEAMQGNGHSEEEASEAKEFDPEDMDPETMQGAKR